MFLGGFVVGVFAGLLLIWALVYRHGVVAREYPEVIDFGDPTVCHCGVKHPLVAEHGVCGSCAEQLYGYGHLN